MEKIAHKTLKDICWRNKTFHLVIIALIVLAVYANSLPNKFNFDDPSLLLDNPAVHGLTIKNLKAIFTSVPNSVEYLPVRDFTYALDYEIWALRPWGYHLSNLLYYLAVCLALYAFLSRLLNRFGEESPAAAFFAVLLFALHPVHVESVAGIAQRKDVLNGLFFFLSLWSFMVYQERAPARRAGWWYVLAVFFFVLSFFSKAHAVVLPLIVLLLNHLYPPPPPRSPWRRWMETLVFFVVTVSIAVIHLRIAQATGIINFERGSPWERIPTAARAVFYYLKMLVFPYPLTVWHEFRFSQSFGEPSVIVCLLGIILFLIFIWKYRKTLPGLSFAGAYYLLCLAPVVGLLPNTMLIAERYLFIPSAGFCLALGWIFYRGIVIGGKRAYALGAVFLVFILVFAGLCVSRNSQWKNMETLMLADLAHAPQSVRLNQALGRYYFNNGRYREAFAYMQKLKELDPRDVNYEFYLALFLYQRGKYAEALLMLEKIPLAARDQIDIHYLYGRVHQARGDYSKARESYLQALESRRMMGIFFKSNVKAALEELEEKGQQ